ncbi:MAG: aminotransferase class V-fold PLP-dependent enzyme [Rhabdochlamydiaceae bacterium]|nr:aminotransferase class V-fold PLP-dependent enzyme [Rhabdochlamydiaceae bacterium]
MTYSIWNSNSKGLFDLAELEQLIQTNTKLIALNHASNVLGVLSPVRSVGCIAKRHGISLLIDVAQTAGLFPVNFGDFADYIAGTGHKSLLGPPGVGFLYVKNPDTLSTLHEGGSGQHSLSPFHPEEAPDKFESGTLNYVGIAGLKGALCYIENYGQELLRKKVMQLTEQAMKLLSELPGITIYGTQEMEHKVPLLSFNCKGYFANEIGYLLNQHEIFVRCGLHCAPLIHRSVGTLPHGTVRVSLGHHNTLEEIHQLCDILHSLGQQ